MHLYAAEPDASGDIRVRQANPRHLHLAILARPANATKHPSLAKQDRVLPSIAIIDRPVAGKKELTGRTDIEIEISNQCGRLVANVIIYYNSAILSRLLVKYEASSNPRILKLIKKISPAAWRHILLNGHYTFRSGGRVIDLDMIMAGLVLE